ncbi:MAG: hypothetical protein KDK62_02480 [Chlamydiia bacterium]|nr:hypothetical protein [Chlamydiia bacterium]
MIRKPSDTQAVGLHLDGTTLRLAFADVVRKKVNIKRLEAFSLKEENGSLGFLDAREKAICLELCDKYLVALAAPGKETLVRKLKMKLTKPKDVEQAFPFEAEALIPYPIEEAVIDKVVVARGEEETELTLLAAKKEALSGALAKLNHLSLDPESLTTAPAALAAFAGEYAGLEEPLLALYIGEATTLSAVIHKGKLLSSHTAQNGLGALKAAYEKDQERDPELLPNAFSQFDFESDDVLLAASLHSKIESLKKETQRILHAETKDFDLNKAPVLFLGEAATLKGLDQLLFKEMPVELVELKTNGGSELSQSLLKTFAVAIGASLSSLQDYPNPINFRQDDLAYPEPWKRFKGALIMFGGSALLLAVIIFLFGQAFVGLKEDQLRASYGTLLADLKRSHKGFESFYADKRKLSKPEEGEFLDLKSLSTEGISDRLSILDEEIKKQPDYFPLHPNVPLVSDTLAWIASHPKIKGEEGAIQIESFTYQMVKKPDMTKKSERYQVKVDLEITAPTPKMAREFHAALIEPNSFIDPKAEVKWNAGRGKYQTSFYLKDKTSYLSGGKG